MTDTNKAAVRRFWEEVIVNGDMAAFDELVSPSFVDLHRRTGDDANVLRAAIAEALETTTSQSFEEIQIAGDGDVVFALVDYTFTLPDGTSKTQPGIVYYRLEDGRIVESMMAAPQ